MRSQIYVSQDLSCYLECMQQRLSTIAINECNLTFPTTYYAALLPIGGGRIMRRTLSVRLSVRPSRYRYRASRRAT